MLRADGAACAPSARIEGAPLRGVEPGERAEGARYLSGRHSPPSYRASLRAKLRRYAVSKRVALCGRSPISWSQGVTIAVSSLEGRRRAKYVGVRHCNHIWDCPTCAARLRTQRGAKIARVVDASPSCWRLLTLTVRHSAEDDPSKLMRGLSRAWARMRAGRAGQERFHGPVVGHHYETKWKNGEQVFLKCGAPAMKRVNEHGGLVEAYVRTWDVTQGARGFHPHVHVLVKFKEGVDVDAWRDAWALDWIDAVRTELGPAHTPSLDVGTHMSKEGAGKTYVAKMGLELADYDAHKSSRHAFEVSANAAKRAAGSSRSPWELAADVAREGRGGDIYQWTRYQDAVRGRRCIEWSRDAAALERRLVEYSAVRDEKPKTETMQEAGDVVLSDWKLWPEEWAMVRAYERIRPPALHDLLCVAEREGLRGVEAWMVGAASKLRGRQEKRVDADNEPRSLLTDVPY